MDRYRNTLARLASRERRLAIAELAHLLWTDLAAPAAIPTARAVEGLLRTLRLPVNASFAAGNLARAAESETNPAARALAIGLVAATSDDDPLLSLAKGRHPDVADEESLELITPHLTRVFGTGHGGVNISTLGGAIQWLRGLPPAQQARAAALAVDGSAGFILPVVAGAMTKPGKLLIQQLQDEIGRAVQTVIERPTTPMPDPTVTAWWVEWRPDELLRPLLLPGETIPVQPDTSWAAMLPPAAWTPDVYVKATTLISTAAIELMAMPADTSRSNTIVEKAIAAWQMVNPRCTEDASGSLARYIDGWMADVQAVKEEATKPTTRCWVWLQFEHANTVARWHGQITAESGDTTPISGQARGTSLDIGTAAADSIVALLTEPALLHVVVALDTDTATIAGIRESLSQSELVMNVTMHLESRTAG